MGQHAHRHRHRRGRLGGAIGVGVPLTKLPVGGRGRISSLPGEPGLASRLFTLGLFPGKVVRVIENRGGYPWAPILVEVEGIRIVLGKGVASRILVEPIDSGDEDKRGGEEVTRP